VKSRVKGFANPLVKIFYLGIALSSYTS